jgi:hypothetical protein
VYLDGLADAIAVSSKDPEAFAGSPAAQRGAAAAEATFGGPAKKRERPSTVEPS